jgi:hypothetical protein
MDPGVHGVGEYFDVPEYVGGQTVVPLPPRTTNANGTMSTNAGPARALRPRWQTGAAI